MPEPLAVDPSRLEAAGIKLAGLVFPLPPAPVSAAGTDSISAAINETLPFIESPVIGGLPAAKAALMKTGSNIATAAGMYAKTDQALGDQFSQFGQHQLQLTGEAPADQPPTASDETPSTPAAASDASAAVTDLPVAQLGQAAGMAGMVGSVAQGVFQGAQQMMGSMQTSGLTTAKGQPTDKGQLVDETTKADDEQQHPESDAEGAAPGQQDLQSIPAQDGAGAAAGHLQASPSQAPVEPLTPDLPDSAPSEIDLV